MPPSSDWDTNYIVQSRRTFIDVEHEHVDSGIKQMVATLRVFSTLLITAVQNDSVARQRQGHQHSQGHRLVSAAAANIPQAKWYKIPNSKEEQTVLLEGKFWFNLHHGLVISGPAYCSNAAGWDWKTAPKAVRRKPGAKCWTTACHVEKHQLK